MKPETKIIDAQALAKYIESIRDAAGMVKAADVLAWVIGANNKTDHRHAKYLGELERLGDNPPMLFCFVDRENYVFFNEKSFRKSAHDYFKRYPLTQEDITA